MLISGRKKTGYSAGLVTYTQSIITGTLGLRPVRIGCERIGINNRYCCSSDAYSTVYAILQYGARIRINEYTESYSRANRVRTNRNQYTIVQGGSDLRYSRMSYNASRVLTGSSYSYRYLRERTVQVFWISYMYVTADRQ